MVARAEVTRWRGLGNDIGVSGRNAVAGTDMHG